MSAIFGETLTLTQGADAPIRLVVVGDETHARYETPDGYTVVYDGDVERYCYAEQVDGRLVSTGRPASERAPSALARHAHDNPEIRNAAVRDRIQAMFPTDEGSPVELERLRTFGSQNGLLPGRVLSSGTVRGLTILVTFADTPTTVTTSDIDALLNGPAFREHGNASSVFEYFQVMSTGRLHYTSRVVGPYRLSRPKLTYANVDGLLVPEAIQLAIDDGVDLAEFDSLGMGVVDALCIMYAGQTEYRGDLWPHNWVHRTTHHGVSTELYIVTSMGRTPADLSIGTFCHETGHMLFRWPDLYDYGEVRREGDDFKSAGIGTYCVMGSGNHLDHGRTPAPVSVYLRDLVGWCGKQVDLNAGGQFSVTHGDYDTALRYATGLENEYFLVENRTQLGYDLHLPASGLAVYHCDTLASNEFQQGTRQHHYQCALLQADGHLDLEHAINLGDGGDLYASVGGTALSHSSAPSSRRWDGADSGLTISGISPPGATIELRLGAVGESGVEVSGESAPGAFIPDNRPGGVNDVITLDGQGTVASLSVSISVSHTWIGDLRVVLLSPTGKRAILHNRSGGSADNLELRLDSDPPSALAPLVGQPVTGSWRLVVSDNARVDTGTLERWSIKIRTAT